MCGAEHFQSEIVCLIFCGRSATSGFDSQMVGGRFRPEDLRGLRTAEGLHLAIHCHHFTSYHTLPLLAPCYTLQSCTLLYPAIPCLHLAIPSHHFASSITLFCWGGLHVSKMREHQLEKAIDDPSV